MSTLSGVTQKGEKGKSKFQSLDINNLYNQTSRGDTSEPHQTKSTAPRRHGMQTLGKVPSTRRPPANLPSLKSEHSGNDPSVSLVPSGGTGWGSKPGETGPSPASQPTPPAATPTPPTVAAPQTTHGSSAPAAGGIGMPAAPSNLAPPQAQPPPMMKPIIGSSGSGDKTWSSVTCGDTGPSFLAHQSPQFQQEFPSLSGEGAGQAPPGSGGGGKGAEQYGPGPSLRPQTEGSWIAGGALRGAGSGLGGPAGLAPPSHPPQHPYLPQEIVGGSQSGGPPRGNLGPFGAGGGPVGLPSGAPPPSTAPPVPSQFRNVMPSFLQKSAGFSGFPPPTTSSSSSNFQNNIRPPRFNPPDMSRYNNRHADPDDVISRPIIREEDLTRMDEISRDAGWAANNDIDYDQKIAFSDDESTGVDDDKDSAKDKASKDADKRDDRRDNDADKDVREVVSKPVDRIPNEKQMWAGRQPTGPVEFRQYPRQPHSQQMSSETEDDHWSEKRRQTSENIKQVTEKAKQRKEEEEKKYEESRSKGMPENDMKIKVKKDDDRHVNSSPITEWDNNDSSNKSGGVMSHSLPPSKDSMNESGARDRDFRNMQSSMDGRSDNMRGGDRYRNDRDRDRDRMDGGRGYNQPPRFMKSQQHSRQPPNSVYDRDRDRDRGDRDRVHDDRNRDRDRERGDRWSSQNSHGPMPYKQMRRGQPDLGGDLSENERYLHKDDKPGRMHNDERDRYRPNARSDGGHDSNRKNNYYGDGPIDYNRPHHRDFDHNNRERMKENDYRQRDRDEPEWEGRRGNNNSWGEHKQFDDKGPARKDPKKSEPFHKPQSSSFGDDRDMDRPQRPESRDRPDRPARPDSRDSRASRDSRNSRDSIREDTKSIPESSDFAWGASDYDKDSKEDKSRKKDIPKEEKREPMPRREGHGHVPGPITREKLHAYEIKQLQSKTDKKEIISSTLINSLPEEDLRNKLVSAPSAPMSNLDGWSENIDMGVSAGSLAKEDSPQPMSLGLTSDEIGDKSSLPKDDFDKKKDGALKDKDGKVRGGGRGPRTGGRQGGDRDRPFNQNSGSNFFFNRNAGGPAPYQRDNNRRRGQGKGPKDKGQMGSDSEGSLDEVSASTESGKEDKKSDRRLAPRSSRSGERKKDKDERNCRETKKIENDKNAGRKHGGIGGGYESVGRKEGFAPRGEPSRRGRGGFRTGGRGHLGNVGGHYGPPGSKSPFPQTSHHLLDNKSAEEDAPSEKPLDMDHTDDKLKKAQQQSNITGGNHRPKEPRKGDVIIKNKMRGKGGSGEDRDSTSEGGSDSDTKKGRNLQKADKNKSNQRAAGDKRGAPYNAAHMNGRPSRSDEGKDNGFQEVKGKKVGKESRPLSRGRNKDGKGKSGPPGSGGILQAKNSNPSGKPFQREWSNNNKPPRMQKLDNQRKQQQLAQQEVSEMNKINQSVAPLFSSTIRDVNNCMAPAPPPTKSAWEKPITAALRASSPPSTLHLSSAISSTTEKPGMEIPEHVQSGTSSQTSSPSAEKALSAKLGREVDKGMLDGTTAPVQTIIFENTNYKTPELAIKSKYSLKPNQRIDKGRGKLDDELEGATHSIGGLTFKTGVDLSKSCDSKAQESLQIPMAFKNEDNADMKLDFPFDSDLSQLTDEKPNIPRSTYLGQSSAELNQKIASVKKVWDTASSAMEHQHHVDESHGVVSTSSSSFTPNFGGSVDSALDHSAHQVDDNSFNNADVYSPGMQGGGGGYSAGAASMMKPDPSNPSSGVKPNPQQAAVMSTTIGTHSGQSLSSPPPPFNQAGHFSYQAQYGNISTIPSPPAVLVNPQGQVPGNTQDYVAQHPYPFSSPMIGNQTQRTNFSQQPTYSPYSLTQNLTQSSYSQPQSMYIPTQPAGNPAPPELFPSAYRLQATYGQSPQINNNPSTVLITSSSNSLMSASVKNTPQQPPLGAIGTKAAYQNSQAIQMSFMGFDQNLMQASYLPPTSHLVTQRHAGGNVTPGMQPSTSFYSGSTGAPGGFSSLLGTNSQSMHSAATAFSMPSFSNQSAATPGAAPPSSNVGHPSYSTIGHFQRGNPQSYMKQGGGPGPHQPDASKSPSNNQDVLSNSVFSASGGGGQIPSPKSRTGGSNSSSGKQVSVSPQQPSPTQTHHKFPSYPPQNLVGQPPPNSQSGPQRAGSQLVGGVRTNNGSGNPGLNNAVHMKYPPGPIQRPGPGSAAAYQQQQVYQALAAQQQQQQQQQQGQQRHRVQQQQQARPSPQQTHVKNNYFIQQGPPVKLDTGMEVKGDTDKFMDNGPNPTKPDKKEEVAGSEN